MRERAGPPCTLVDVFIALLFVLLFMDRWIDGDV